MSSKAVNIQTLCELKDLMEDEFSGLVDAFIYSSEETLDGMEQAYSQGDIDAFIRNAHSLKSSSSNLGCEQLSLMAANIEESSKINRQLPGDTHAMAELRLALDSARAIIRTL